MDPITLITLLGGVVTILGFLYVLFIGQKSLPEWWTERREKRRASEPPPVVSGAEEAASPSAPAPAAAPPVTGHGGLVGQSLAGYTLVAKIGEGGMGAVYRAYQPSMDRQVAIKVLPERLAQDEQFIQRFRREARAIARLEHPHILPAYDFGEQAGVMYIAMRYVDGGTLKERIARGPLPPDEIMRIVEQVAEALDYAHQMGIVHRDIKPGNILLDARGQAFLGDFGLARMVAASQQISSGHGAIGTPAYMAPEQGQGLPASPLSDIYSLGVVVYEMATGRIPYDAETPVAIILKHINDPLPRPRALAPDLPEALEQAILRAMDKSPARRFQSAAEMAAALRGVPAAPPAGAPEPVPLPPPVRAADFDTLLLDSSDLAESELLASTEELPAFIAGPPITHPARFFGRERELKRIFGLLQRPPLQNAAIIGPRRSGKTSLLRYLKSISTAGPDQLRPGQRSDWLPQPGRYRWIFVDFQDPRMGSREALLRYILLSLSLPPPDPCLLDRFVSVVKRGLRTPTVILFDEIGVALQRYSELDDAFWESLRALATNQVSGNLAFVLASHETPSGLAHQSGLGSPFFNIFGYTCTLGPLAEPEARELVRNSPLKFPDEDVAWILENSRHWPILLQLLCRERLAALEEGDPGEGWRAEGLKQMAPFRHLLEGQA